MGLPDIWPNTLFINLLGEFVDFTSTHLGFALILQEISLVKAFYHLETVLILHQTTLHLDFTLPPEVVLWQWDYLNGLAVRFRHE